MNSDYYLMMKKTKYRALLYKMQSIKNKSSRVNDKVNSTKSTLKTTLNIDGDILDSNSYNNILRTVSEADSSVSNTLAIISSNL